MVAQCIRDNFITIKWCVSLQKRIFHDFFCNVILLPTMKVGGHSPDFEENAYLLKVGGTLSNFLKCLYLLIFWWVVGGTPGRPDLCLYNTFTAPKANDWCETHQIEKLSLSCRHFENKDARENKTPSLQQNWREVWRKCGQIWLQWKE